MDTSLAQSVLKFMNKHKTEPLGLYTIQGGLEQEQNVQTSAPVLESTLKEMQDSGYIYPTGGYWYLTHPGSGALDAKRSPAAKYQQIQSQFQHVNAKSRDASLDAWRSTLQEYYKFFKETHPEYQDWFKYVERSKGQMDEFFKDTLALFLKWDITKEPLVKYPQEEQYTYPEGMIAIEHALDESMRRFVKYMPVHKDKIIEQDVYRAALDKTQEILNTSESTLLPKFLSNFTKGAVVSGAALEQFVTNFFKTTVKGIKPNSVVIKTLANKISTILTPQNGIIVDGMTDTLIAEVLISFLNTGDVRAFNQAKPALSSATSGWKSLLETCLSGKNFNSKNFVAIDLSNLTITNTSFDQTNLSKSYWQGSSLVGVDLTQANLTGANFKVDATDCIFDGADFADAEVNVGIFTGTKNFGLPKNVTSTTVKQSKENLQAVRRDAKNTFSHSFPLSGADVENGRMVAKVLQAVLGDMGKVSSLKFSSMWDELKAWKEGGSPPESIPVKGLFPWLRQMKENGQFEKHGYSGEDIAWFFQAAKDALKSLPPKPKQENVQQIRERENQEKVTNAIAENEGQAYISTQSLLSLVEDKEGFLYSWLSGFGTKIKKSEAYSILHSLSSSIHGYHLNDYVKPTRNYVPFPYSTRVDPIYEGASKTNPYGSAKNNQFGVVLNVDYSLLPKDVRMAVDVAMMTAGTHLYNAMSHAVILPMVVTKVDLVARTPSTEIVWVVGEMQNDIIQKIMHVRDHISTIFKDRATASKAIEHTRSFFRDWPENLFNAILELAGQMNVSEIWMPSSKDIGQGDRDWSAYYQGAAESFGAQLKSVGQKIRFNPYHGTDSDSTSQFYVVKLNSEQGVDKEGVLRFSTPTLKFTSIEKVAEIDMVKWQAATLAYVKTFVEMQQHATPDLGNKETLAKDGYAFMMDWLPADIKEDAEFPGLINWLRTQLQEEGYGDILAANNDQPDRTLQNPELQNLSDDDDDDEGDIPVTPAGEPVGNDSGNILQNLQFSQEDMQYEKDKLIDEQLEKLQEAMNNHDQVAVNRIKKQIDDLNSTSALRFSSAVNDVAKYYCKFLSPPVENNLLGITNTVRGEYTVTPTYSSFEEAMQKYRELYDLASTSVQLIRVNANGSEDVLIDNGVATSQVEGSLRFSWALPKSKMQIDGFSHRALQYIKDSKDEIGKMGDIASMLGFSAGQPFMYLLHNHFITRIAWGRYKLTGKGEDALIALNDKAKKLEDVDKTGSLKFTAQDKKKVLTNDLASLQKRAWQLPRTIQEEFTQPEISEKAKSLYESGEWVNFVSPSGLPMRGPKKYIPGELVASMKDASTPRPGRFYYIGSFRSPGTGAYVLLNEKGEVRKSVNIRKIEDLKTKQKQIVFGPTFQSKNYSNSTTASEQPQFDYDYTRKNIDHWDNEGPGESSRDMHQYYNTDLMYLEDPQRKEKELGTEYPQGGEGILPGGFAASNLKLSWNTTPQIYTYQDFKDLVMSAEVNKTYYLPGFYYKRFSIDRDKIYGEMVYTWTLEADSKISGSVWGAIFPLVSSNKVKYWVKEISAKLNLIKYVDNLFDETGKYTREYKEAGLKLSWQDSRNVNDVVYKNVNIRVKDEFQGEDEWHYALYINGDKNGGKWKCIRRRGYFESEEKALTAAKTYIDEFYDERIKKHLIESSLKYSKYKWEVGDANDYRLPKVTREKMFAADGFKFHTGADKALVLVDDTTNEDVGFLGFSVDEGSESTLTRVVVMIQYILPEYRGRGLGKEMQQIFVDYLNKTYGQNYFIIAGIMTDEGKKMVDYRSQLLPENIHHSVTDYRAPKSEVASLKFSWKDIEETNQHGLPRFWDVNATSHNRESQRPTSLPRTEKIDIIENGIFNGEFFKPEVSSEEMIKGRYESFWNDLNHSSSDIVKVNWVRPSENQKTVGSLKFSFDDMAENQDYFLNMDVQPDELVQEAPTTQKERYDIVKYRHNPDREEMYFEKGLHKDPSNINVDRPLTPFG